MHTIQDFEIKSTQNLSTQKNSLRLDTFIIAFDNYLGIINCTLKRLISMHCQYNFVLHEKTAVYKG